MLEFFSGMSTAARHRFAIDDVRAGLRLWRLAWSLGWLDIRLRYRGSMLGPFWLSISTGVMVGSLGFLYAALWHISLRDYLPFLALSQVLWGFLATLVGESCAAFTESEPVIRSIRMPFFLFAMRILVRNVLVLAHNICVIVVVFVSLRIWPGATALLAIPALPLWIADALALSLLLGGICARFRDILPIVNSVMQIAFFLSPVIWKPGNSTRRAMRSGCRSIRSTTCWRSFAARFWARCPRRCWSGSARARLYSAILCGVAWLFFLRARGRIAFWI